MLRAEDEEIDHETSKIYTDLMVFITVENAIRELMAKLVLAKLVYIKGNNVVVGWENEVLDMVRKCEDSVLFDHKIITRQDDYIEIKNNGNNIVNTDEEGLMYENDENYVKERIPSQALKKTDVHYTWGKNKESVMSEIYPTMKCKIKGKGNIRFDILKDKFKYVWKKRANKLENKYGKFLLINTNFSRYNSPAGISYPKNGKWNLQKNMFKEFKNLVKKISNRIREKIVLRPHPGERVNTWKKIFEGNKEVDVVRSGAVTPWILASECVIHNNCTTSVESYMLGRKVISYEPIENKYQKNILDEISYSAKSFKEVISLKRKDINQKYDNSKLSRELGNTDSYVVYDIAKDLDRLNGNEKDINKSILSRMAKSTLRKVKYEALRLFGNKAYINQLWRTEKLERKKMMKSCKSVGIKASPVTGTLRTYRITGVVN